MDRRLHILIDKCNVCILKHYNKLILCIKRDMDCCAARFFCLQFVDVQQKINEISIKKSTVAHTNNISIQLRRHYLMAFFSVQNVHYKNIYDKSSKNYTRSNAITHFFSLIRYIITKKRINTICVSARKVEEYSFIEQVICQIAYYHLDRISFIYSLA